MEQHLTCSQCGQLFVLTGTDDSTKKIMQAATCPECGHPNEVLWPVGASWSVFVPDKRHRESKSIGPGSSSRPVEPQN
jgi:DNA-directed RNA polymerase subunit RPC12/RpoP